MLEVVIVDAVRSPVRSRNGAVSGVRSTDLLGVVQRERFTRAELDPAAEVFSSVDAAEGPRAFTENRVPVWSGR